MTNIPTDNNIKSRLRELTEPYAGINHTRGWRLTAKNVETVLKALGLEHHGKIGRGANGVVIDCGDKVVKFTSDKTEVNNVKLVVGKPTKHIARYYTIRKLTSKTPIYHRDIYVMVLEKLSPVPNNIKTLINTIVYNTTVTPQGADMPDIKDFNKPQSPEFEYVYDQLKMVYDEVVKYKVSDQDMHGDNFGMRGKDIVAFDMAFGDVDDAGDIDDIEIAESTMISELSVLDRLLSYIRPRLTSNNQWYLDKKEIKEILNVFGYRHYAVMGKGTMGIALDVGNDTVIKLTTDKSEANNVYRLLGKKFKHIATYHDIKQMSFKKPKEGHPIRDLYLIKMEELAPLTDKMRNDADEVIRFCISTPDFNDREKYGEIINQLMINNRFATEQIFELMKEAKANGVSTKDLHGHNIGMKNGNIAMFDPSGGFREGLFSDVSDDIERIML